MSEGKAYEGKHHDDGEGAGSHPALPFSSMEGLDREREDDNPALREILIRFSLPDGSVQEAKFRAGQTVEVLKSHLESELDLPMAAQALYLEDKLLLDPMSLNDYHELQSAAEATVRVVDRRGK